MAFLPFGWRPRALIVPLAVPLLVLACADDGGSTDEGRTTEDTGQAGSDTMRPDPETSTGSTGDVADSTGGAESDGTTAAAESSGGAEDTTGGEIEPGGPWLRAIQGEQPDEVGDVAIGSDGSVVGVGFFSATATLDTLELLAPGVQTDGVVAKYDAEGTIQWAVPVTGAERDLAWAVTLDADDDIFIAGIHGGGATLDGMAIPGGPDQHFAARLNPDGTAVWATDLPLTSPVRPADVDVTTGGDVVVAADTEVWTLDADGGLQSTLSIPGVRIEDLDLGADGTIYLAGSFLDTVDIQGTVLTATDFASDAFVARFDADGTLQWVVAAGAEFLDTANGISVVDDGTVFVTGSLQPGAEVGSTDGNPQTIDVENLSAFLAIYDADGVLASVYASAGSDVEDGRPISAPSPARVVMGGHVSGDYDGTPRTAVEGTTSFLHTFDGAGTPGELLLATGNAVELYGMHCVATVCAVAGRFQNSATWDSDTVDQVGAQLDGFVGVVATP